MASRLARLRARLLGVVGRPDPLLADARLVLDRQSAVMLPSDPEHRQQVARICRRAIQCGYRPGAGPAALRDATSCHPEFLDDPPTVCAELLPLLHDLAEVIEPTPFD